MNGQMDGCEYKQQEIYYSTNDHKILKAKTELKSPFKAVGFVDKDSSSNKTFVLMCGKIQTCGFT